MKNRWFRGCASAVFGALFGAVVGVVLLTLFAPTPDSNMAAKMDGLNRWGGHVGAAMIGILFGGVGGLLVAKSEEPFKTFAIALFVFVAVMLFLSQ